MEFWRDIPGYAGYYQASSLGRVKSLDRVTTSKKGTTRTFKGQFLKPVSTESSHGYLIVNLWRDGVKVTRTIHSLIAETFIGPRPEGMEVLHGDGKKKNNKLYNLRYGTSSENKEDSVKHGTCNIASQTGPGERNPNSKLKEADVLDIRKRHADGEATKDIRASYPIVSGSLIKRIIRGELWEHLKVKYDDWCEA